MFAHLSQQYEVRAAALLPIAANTAAFNNGFNRQRGMAFYFTTAARTVGTWSAVLQQSFDGGTTWVNTEVTASGSTVGDVYVTLARPLPTSLRWVLTPAGGFDGTLAVQARSSDVIAV